MGIIEELYYSDIFRVMDIRNNDPEYSEAMEKLMKLESEIVKKFPECKDLFEEYQSAESKVVSIAQRNDFTNGFKAGAQMVMEMMKPIK